MKLVEILEDVIREELDGSAHFLVNSTANNDGSLIKFFLDGDSGIPIEECSRISRVLSKKIDEEELGERAFRLEVSSPGTDEPLRNPRQYTKHVGRKLSIVTSEGESYKAFLRGVEQNKIELEKILESKKGKATKTEMLTMDLKDIKETKVLISFK